jgi:hypothetical protein
MEPAPGGLRPLGIGDILDAMFRLYRSNFLTFVGVAALAQMPLLILQLALQVGLGGRFTADLLSLTQELTFFNPGRDSLADLPLGSVPLFIIVSLLLGLVQFAVVQQLVSGALTNAIARSYLGQPTSVLGAYQLGVGRIGALIGAGLLVSLFGLLVFMIFFGIYIGAIVLIVSVAGAGESSFAVAGAVLGIIAVFGLLILALIAVLFLWLRFLFITQAIVVEQKGALAAIARSWRLIRGSFWRTLGIYLLLSILVQIIVAVPVGTASFAINFALGDPSDPLDNFALRQSLTAIISYAAQILVLPLQLTAFTVLYYDLRVRKEGYDLELRSAEGAV